MVTAVKLESSSDKRDPPTNGDAQTADAVRSTDLSVPNRGSTDLGSHNTSRSVNAFSRSLGALAQPRLEVVCPRIPLGPTPRLLILSAWLSTLLVLVLVTLTGWGHKQNDIGHNFKLNFQLQRAMVP